MKFVWLVTRIAVSCIITNAVITASSTRSNLNLLDVYWWVLLIVVWPALSFNLKVVSKNSAVERREKLNIL